MAARLPSALTGNRLSRFPAITGMSVRTLAAAAMIISVLLLAALVAATFWAQRNIDHAQAVDRLTVEISRSALELNVLTGDLLLHDSGETARQWRRRHQSLTALLERGRQDYPEFSAELTALSSIARGLAERFDILAGAGDANRRQSLAGDLNAEARALVEGSRSLQQWAESESAFASRVVAWLSFMVLGGVVVLVAVQWIGFDRLVLGPLANLRTGIDRLAEGKLDHRIPETGGAEFRELTGAFNETTRRLQTTTVSRDILQAEVEARRRTEEALTRSNEELKQFAYVASHDLQEPLRAVSSYVQLLERRYSEHFDARARDYINFVVDGAQRMKDLIDGLLAYSRVTTKGAPMTKVDASQVLETAKRNLETAIAESGAQIRCRPLPRVQADAGQLVHVIQNLIANAIKYRGSAAPVIEIAASEEDGFAHFTVADNGIGMDPRYADRIFLLFQRLHRQEEYPGSGLGLALSKRVIERHGGRIWVESQPDEGSTFHFTIPTARQEDSQ